MSTFAARPSRINQNINQQEDMDRIRDMMVYRDLYIEEPNIETAVAYAASQYYGWHHDRSDDGSQGRIVY